MIVRLIILLISVILPAYSGGIWQIYCPNMNCYFHFVAPKHPIKGAPPYIGNQLYIGGGFEFERIDGFCHKCEKIVRISWVRGGSSSVPKCIGTTFDGILKVNREIYFCPNCSEPFIEFPCISGLDICPICYSNGFKANLFGYYD